MNQERNQRIQGISEVEKHLTEFRNEVDTSIGKSKQRYHDSSSDGVIIGGWTQNSKDDAIKLVKKTIEDKVGQPKIMMETVAMIPKVIPVKFDSKDSAELFVRQYAGKHIDFFSYRFEIFWCDINQTPK